MQYRCHWKFEKKFMHLVEPILTYGRESRAISKHGKKSTTVI